MSFKSVLFLCILSIATPLQAEVMVMVHGYASDHSSWQKSGVTATLARSGWQHVGLPGEQRPGTNNVFYTVQLPANQSLYHQSQVLMMFLQRLRQRHATDHLTLIGHSAGGVVSRLVLLNGNLARVSRLITIASPHQGTPRAMQGLDVVDDKPFFCPGPGWDAMKSFFGGDAYDYLERSQSALVDMLPAFNNQLLAWGNQQVHPNIEYHSVVRQHDKLVPPASQDMASIASIGAKSNLWLSPVGHVLHPIDGQTILNVLRYSRR